MSTRIRILPENLTNRIAAGEVVERPASAVKELVENALDAGCSDVMVEIEAGGKRLIRIVDNGCGMSREDALLSLERHATSKIATDADLFHLATLGFRGEALPSIASVSRFSLATRPVGADRRTEIYSEGGRIKEVKACGMAQGTVVSVRNLFFNTPPRLKFLKSTETEAGHVGEFLTRLAISRPAVRFTYVNDGRTVFRALDGDLRNRIVSLLGPALGGNLYPVEYSGEGISVTGLIAPPIRSFLRFPRLYLYQRPLHSRPGGPACHPPGIPELHGAGPFSGGGPVHRGASRRGRCERSSTKHEVRFREQGKVHDALQAAVMGVLGATPWVKPVTARPAAHGGRCAGPPAASRGSRPGAGIARPVCRPDTAPGNIHVPAPQVVPRFSGTAELTSCREGRTRLFQRAYRHRPAQCRLHPLPGPAPT